MGKYIQALPFLPDKPEPGSKPAQGADMQGRRMDPFLLQYQGPGILVHHFPDGITAKQLDSCDRRCRQNQADKTDKTRRRNGSYQDGCRVYL
jgi:hypothetical protein